MDYETPEEKQKVLADLSVKLSDRSSLVDLLVSLRGSHVILRLNADEMVSGCLIGVETSIEVAPMVILQQNADDAPQIVIYLLADLHEVTLLDSRAALDVDFFLEQTRYFDVNSRSNRLKFYFLLNIQKAS